MDNLNEDHRTRKATTLRPYQFAAVDRRRSRLRDCRRVLLALPTGGGKTVIASHIIERAHVLERRVVFFAHRRELILNTRKKLIEADIPPAAIGIMMANDPHTDPTAPIQVASIDTWRHREPPPADLVIVDEAHRSLARTYLNAIKHYSESGAVVLGMTATPYRADGRGLGDVYEALEIISTPAELIELGYLVEPRVFSAPAPDLSKVRVQRGDYVEADLAAVMTQSGLVGDIVETWQKRAQGVRTVAFAVNVAHSQAIAATFVDAGIPGEHLDGTTPTKERDAILARLESGETLVVSNCGVLCEGWDQPAVKCAILARPTKSTGLYLQQAGRILRPYEGQRAIILDHAGNAHAHGLPQDDRDLDLDTAKRGGRGGGQTKTCPECSATVPGGSTTCPECGYEWPPSQEEPPPVKNGGDLVEIDPVERAKQIAAWRDMVGEWRDRCERRIRRGERPIKPGWIYHRYVERYGVKPPPSCKLPAEIASEDEKREAYEALLMEANERGYKAGWAKHRYKARFGEWPDRSRKVAVA